MFLEILKTHHAHCPQKGPNLKESCQPCWVLLPCCGPSCLGTIPYAMRIFTDYEWTHLVPSLSCGLPTVSRNEPTAINTYLLRLKRLTQDHQRVTTRPSCPSEFCCDLGPAKSYRKHGSLIWGWFLPPGARRWNGREPLPRFCQHKSRVGNTLILQLDWDQPKTEIHRY